MALQRFLKRRTVFSDPDLYRFDRDIPVVRLDEQGESHVGQRSGTDRDRIGSRALCRIRSRTESVCQRKRKSTNYTVCWKCVSELSECADGGRLRVGLTVREGGRGLPPVAILHRWRWIVPDGGTAKTFSPRAITGH